MTIDPRTEEDVEDSLETSLSGKIAKLTNFVATSFNKTWLNAFSEQIREFEIKLLAVQLSGWVDYAGGPITENDLQNLDLEFSDVDALEQFIEDDHLDELGKVVGVSRDQGSFASGQVTIQTASDTTQIQEGTRVATAQDSGGDSKVFLVDADADGEIDENSTATVSPSAGNTEVTVDIISEERGNEYNVGSGAITRFVSPPPGVEGVTNNSSISGGSDVQSNDDYRDDIKNAVFETSGGGTTAGIRGFIEDNVTGVSDVIIDEFLNEDPVRVDVVVDGGSRQDVLDAIETSRPAGIRHDLVRPETLNIGVDVELLGSDIDTQNVQDQIEEYLFDIELGDNLVRDKLIQAIMNADDDIENILTLNVRITSVVEEKQEYQSGTTAYDLGQPELGHIVDEQHYYITEQDVYELAAFPVESGTTTITATVGGNETTLNEGTDYDIVDDNGDGELESVDFSVGGSSPDDETVWSIEYDLLRSVTGETETYVSGTDVYELDHRPVSQQGAAITDANSNTYELGTDFDIVDSDSDGVLDSVDFSVGGSSPNNGVDFFVDYELRTGTIDSVTADVSGTETELLEDTTDVQGDYDELDSNGDTYADQIDFSVGGSNPDDTTDFIYTYYTNTNVENDLTVTERQKSVPDTDEITITTYLSD